MRRVAVRAATNGRRSFSSSFLLRAEDGLSEDNLELFNMSKEFASKEMLPHAEQWDQEEIFPRQVFRQLGDLGFGAIYAPEERSGSGLSRLAAATIFEALSTACVSTTAFLSIHNMANNMIARHGVADKHKGWNARLATMELIASYCLTEPGAGSDAASLRTTATRDGEHYVLNGEKAFISGGGESDLYVVMCRTGEAGHKGISTVVVEKGTPGLSFGKKERKVGWNSQPTRAVIMDNVRVPVENRLGEEGQGFKIALEGLDGGRVNIAACGLGGAQASLEAAVEHSLVRRQFGSAIADFQSVQFKLADFATRLVASRIMVRNAASKVDAGDPSASVFCASTKRFATDACFEVANGSMQILGGYGYLKDYPVQRYMRDLRVHQVLEGTNEIMQVICARDILKQ